jgi:hypothetical protein
MRAPERTFFFIHVRKTGRGTLREHIRASFRVRNVWPWRQLHDNRPIQSLYPDPALHR